MSKFAMAMVVVGCVLTGAGFSAGADPEEGKYYRIKNVRSNKVLSVSDEGKEEGAQVIQVVPGPKNLQEWKFVKIGDYYKIVNHKTGKALNVQGESKEEGAPVIQWDASVDNENQQWSLMRKGEFFAFKARHSGLVLDVGSGTKERKAPLIQYPLQEKENENQIFELVPVKNKK